MLFGRECYPYKTLESLEFRRAKCKFVENISGVKRAETFAMMMNAE